MSLDMAASAVSLALSTSAAAFSVACAVRCARARRRLSKAVRARQDPLRLQADAEDLHPW